MPKALPQQELPSPSDIAWLQWAAAKRPDPNKLRALVEAHGLLWRGYDGCGPFVWTMRQQRKHASGFVQMLIAEGFDPNETQSPLTPLFEACYQSDLKSLKLLLAAGADPNREGVVHPLGQACLAKPARPFVEELIKAGAGISHAPRFDGLVIEIGREMDDFDAFHPRAPWNWLAAAIASREDGALWSEFSLQMRGWSEDRGTPRFINEMSAWLAGKEAEMLLQKADPTCITRSTGRRL